MRKDNKRKNIIILVFQLIFIIMLIYSLIEIIIWYINNKENEKITNEMGKAIIIDKPEETELEQDKYSIDFKTLKEDNNDTVAFLKVKGTNIETVVVQGNDNEYYLNHNFNKKNNKAGWVFADYKNKLDGTDKNIVVYGHNMRDGSMFGTLKNVLKEEWYNNEENRYITFITENEQIVYEIFSVYQIKDENYYITTEFTNTEFEEYLKTVKARSVKDFAVQLTTEDSILTLSTCADNNKYKVVLHAKNIT